MGGYASGRYRTKNRAAIEAATSLDMRRLRKLGFIRPHTETAGVVTWSDSEGRETASIGLSAQIDELAGSAIMRFEYAGESREQTIRIEGRPMRFGGWRYYFVCPVRGHRCERLAVVGGVFASRQAHRLTYRSQSEDPTGRLHRKIDKLQKRLHGQPPRNRPRGQNRERLVEAWVDADSELDARFAAAV